MQDKDTRNKPLIIYLDDDGTTRTTYSDYEITGDLISFKSKA